MKRRSFIALLAGAVTFGLRIAHAQQQVLPSVGFIHSASPDYFAPFVGSFHEGLKEAGYVEGQNVTIERRWAEGHYERLPALVADLLSRNVSIIFAAGGTDPAKAAKAATSTTPIVFVSAADPVRTGLVESLNRPGGNVTGVSLLASSLDGKKLDLLRELAPKAAVFATLLNPAYPDAKLQADQFQAAASQLGVHPIVLSATTDAEIEGAFATLERQHVGAIVLGNDPFFGGKRGLLIELAARYAVPMMYWQREFATSGGLISYGPSFADGYRQAGVYVGRVLKGEKPADLPIVQPTKFEMVVNLKTAKAMGLNVPPNLLALADEVIE
jgi:putative tryptophan/tyrosine transport system substrate-binding protein